MSLGMKVYLDEIGVDLSGFAHLLKYSEVQMTSRGQAINRVVLPMIEGDRHSIVPGIFQFIHSEARQLTDAATELLDSRLNLDEDNALLERLRLDCIAIGRNVDLYTKYVAGTKPWKKLRYEKISGASFWRDNNDNPISQPKSRAMPFSDIPSTKASMVMVDAEDGSPLTPAMCMMSTKFYTDSTGIESAESFLIDMGNLFLEAPCGMTNSANILVDLLTAAHPMLINMVDIANTLNQFGYLADEHKIYDLCTVAKVVRGVTAEDNPNAIIEIGSFS